MPVIEPVACAALVAGSRLPHPQHCMSHLSTRARAQAQSHRGDMRPRPDLLHPLPLSLHPIPQPRRALPLPAHCRRYAEGGVVHHGLDRRACASSSTPLAPATLRFRSRMSQVHAQLFGGARSRCPPALEPPHPTIKPTVARKGNDRSVPISAYHPAKRLPSRPLAPPPLETSRSEMALPPLVT